MDNCIFCKIANKEIPKEFTYIDEDIMVFPDIHPIKPIHILVIPKKHIKDFAAVDDIALYGKIGNVITKMVRQFGLLDKGYKIVVNGGGAQEVEHLHFHILGPMGKAAAV